MNIPQFLIPFFALLGAISALQAQPQAYLDSLEVTLDSIQNPISKAERLNYLAAIYSRIDIEKAIVFSKQSIDWLPQDDYKKLGHVYNTLGSLYGYKNDIQQAEIYLDTAISLYKKANHERGLALIYGNLGASFVQGNNSQKALSYIYKSLEIFERLKDTGGIATNLITLISINFIQEEYDKALQNGHKALAIYTQWSDDYNIALTSFNLGKTYHQLKTIDSSIFYYNQAYQHYSKINNKEGLALVYQDLGILYKDTENTHLALEYIQKALDLEQYINIDGRKIILQNSLASIYLDQKAYAKSIFHYEQALKSAQELGIKSYERDAQEGLALSYAATGQYQKAYQHQLLVTALKDSILNEAKLEQLKELEIKYETNKKEQANILLVQERNIERLKSKRIRQITYTIIIVLVLILLVSYFFWRANQAQNLQQTTQLKHQLLRNQMSPHFIFNALIAIQSFMYKNDVKEAGKYLSSFARLVRAILENSRSEHITLEKEIQWLENYLKLQLLRFDNKFEYNIVVDVDYDTYAIMIPPMLTQPFIENALEHGLKSIDYLGQLEVVFKTEQDLLIIEVMDNGIGIEQSKQNKDSSKHISLATIITEERLAFLNKKQPKNIYFNIKPLPSAGTLVTFSIPIKHL